MKQVLVVYICNNGYSCGCCGQDWEETELHEIDIDVQEFLKKEQESITEWYNHKGIIRTFGREKIIKAYIIQEEIKIENNT